MKHELQEIVAVVNNKGGVGRQLPCSLWLQEWSDSITISGFW